MTYELSSQQKQAVRIMWTELDYGVGDIVEEFRFEGYPISEMQVIRVIRGDAKLEAA